MALQTSGAISLLDVQNEWSGATPISITEYYGVDDGVPGSGTISLDDFYGTSAYVVPSWTSVFISQITISDNFNTPRFDYDYVKRRSGIQSSSWPAGNAGVWLEDLGDTDVNAGGSAWLCVKGNNSAIKAYSIVQINGTSYSGYWGTYSIPDMQVSQGAETPDSTVTAFISSAAGAVVKSAMLGNNSLTVRLFP